MMRRFPNSSRAAGLALLALAGAPASAQTTGFEVGDFLPDFELPTIDGDRTVRPLDFLGKRLLLIEFASW